MENVLFRARLSDGSNTLYDEFNITVQDGIVVQIEAGSDTYDTDEIELEQSIGKEDMNGEEIFEGDKLKGEPETTVRFSTGKIGFVKVDMWGNEYELTDSEEIKK